MNNSSKNLKKDKDTISRRQLLGSAVAVGAFTIVPSYVLGLEGQKPPSEKLNIATVGAGGMGRGNTKRCADAGENIVALCDVDDKKAADVYKTYPNAKTYKDFRKMLEEQKNIDAVIVATPDHTHAVAAIMAIKMGKHVYCQKPLTRTVYEARKLTEAAREAKVATQMGNQGHSGEGIRLVCEWIWAGAIGPVRDVHAWTNRPVWAQGIDRPKEKPPIPKELDWDLWIGPSPERPYNPCYHPFAWRAWVDFGSGALGDMACHILDPAFWALKLKYPVAVEACSSTRMAGSGWDKVGVRDSYPDASIVRYKFPARDIRPGAQKGIATIDCSSVRCDRWKKARPCQGVRHTKEFRNRLSHVGECGSRSEVYSRGHCWRVNKNRDILARMIRAWRNRVISVIGRY